MVAKMAVNPANKSKPIGKYSPAIAVSIAAGDQLLFISGQVSTDENGQTMFPGDPYRQTVSVFEKIGSILSECQAGLSDLVSLTIYTPDMTLFADISRARNEVLADPPPASTFVEVSSLAIHEHLVEISGVAVIAAP